MNQQVTHLRPLAVRVVNFRGIVAEQSLELNPGLTVLVGNNGSGKSSFLAAIEWCLFGTIAVGKSSSGIAERGDWSVANRGAQDDVSVTICFATPQGTVQLQRRSEARTKAIGQLSLTLSDGSCLAAAEVEDWLAWHQFPDWQTWKHSFFQHQEAGRARLTEPAGRTALLSGMLGLGPYRQVHETLKRLRSTKLEVVAEEVLDATAQLQERAIERPHSDLRDWHSQLKNKGIDADSIGKSTLSERARFLVDQAREQAVRLNLKESFIPAGGGSARELLSWAADWPAAIQSGLNVLVHERQQLDRRIRGVEAAQDALKPARRSLQDLQETLDGLRITGGSAERLESELEDLRRQHNHLDQVRHETDQTGKLLTDALQLLTKGADPETCPVCDHNQSDLQARLESRVEQLQSNDLEQQQRQLVARMTKISEQLQDLRSARAAVSAADKQVSFLEDNVRAQVDAATDEPVDRMLLRWREARAALDSQITSAEDHIGQHREEMEILSLMVRVLRAQARTEAASVDLNESSAYRSLQQAIDAAAAFACDIDAVGALARELENRRSEARIKEINEGLAHLYAGIVGKSRDTAVQIKASRTAAAVSYQLVGKDGAVLAGALNQASINALSLACLLASARSRAQRGLPQFLLLDEPAQNLDDAHSQGLADVLAEIAKVVPVVVTTLPGPFFSALERHGHSGQAAVRLNPHSAGQPCGIVR